MKKEIILPLKRVGEYVRKQRKNMDMNQIDFYRYLFPEKTLFEENIKKKMNALENGKGKELNYELLIRLHERFDVSVDYLLGFETEYPNYENREVCKYTGLNPETIKQLHSWSKYLYKDEPEISSNMSEEAFRELSVEINKIREAKWIYEITNMLFQPKSESDIKEGISDLTVLYDMYMMCTDKTEKVYGIPLDVANSELSWYDKIFRNIAIAPDSLSFTDSMNEAHSINIKDITRKIWEERLLRDIDDMISCITNNGSSSH